MIERIRERGLWIGGIMTALILSGILFEWVMPEKNKINDRR
jgi:hypothetical protein